MVATRRTPITADRMCSVRARAFYKAVTVDRSGVLEQILELLNRLSVPYCVVGGQAVNAYVEPLVSLISIWWWPPRTFRNYWLRFHRRRQSSILRTQ